LRWKHIDEFYGQVNTNAIQTYNLKYYFYTSYYTYASAKVYQLDSYSQNDQVGTSCYSYLNTKFQVI